MEAQKTLDKISSDWVLWKRELDTARNMEKDGLPVSKITEYTGLSEEEIKKL